MKENKLYHVIADHDSWEAGYDTFSSFVCYAEDEQQARDTHPSGRWRKTNGNDFWVPYEKRNEWLTVHYLGRYEGKTQEYTNVIIASFHAG